MRQLERVAVRLRDLVSYYIGGGWGKGEPDDRHASPAFVIRGTDMPPARVGDVGAIPFRYHAASNLRSRKLRPYDIIFEVSGGSTDQPVGRSLLVRPRVLAKLDGDAMCASFCKLVRPDEYKVDPRLLYYFLQGIYEDRSIARFQVQSTGISNFQFETFLDEQLILLPPLSEQREIADVLSAYDDLIENNTRRIAILEEMARALYREWFVDFRFPGHEQVEMVESELGPVPAGWTLMPVTGAIEFDPRTRVPKEGEKPFVPMGSLSTGSMLIENVEQRSGNSGSKFRNGDTLFARITPCLENGKTGYVQFLPTDEDVAFGSTEFIVMRSRTLSPEFVYLLARSDGFRSHAIKSMTGATGRQRVQQAAFDGYMIAQPEAQTLRHFSDVAAPMFRMVQVLAKRNANLRRTRDLLLPRLISGEIEVRAAEEALAEAAA